MLKPKVDAAGQPVLDAAGKQVMEEVANPTFSDDQQAFINGLFDKRFSSIQQKHTEAITAKDKEMETLQATIKELQKKVSSGSATGEDEKQFKELLAAEKRTSEENRQAALKAEGEKKQVLEQIASMKKTQEIVRAADTLQSGNKFHDMELVLKLVENNVEWSDEHGQYVVKENGVMRKNSSMLPMTVSEYLEGFAASRPYLVAGKTQGGAGSTEGSRNGQFSVGVVKSKSDLKTPEEKSKFITDFGYEVWEKLPK